MTTRYFYDTEFIEDGHTIQLISIGIVTDDGREFYAVNGDVNQDAIVNSQWLRENVWPSLPTRHVQYSRPRTSIEELDRGHPDVHSLAAIAFEVKEFLLAGELDIELWADYAAYDHVVLCQLWGPMVDLPPGIPMFTHDLQAEARRRGRELPDQSSGAHNALEDARHNLVKWKSLCELTTSPLVV